MPVVTKPGTRELLETVGPQMYRAAYKKNLRLSALLDRELQIDPEKDALDGFGQMLKAAGIKTGSDLERGVYADYLEKWDEMPGVRMLIPEWMGRVWRSVAMGTPNPSFGTRASPVQGGSTDYGLGSLARPFYDYPEPIVRQVQPAIPLAEMVSRTIAVDGDTFRAFYLMDDATTQRMVRVTEFAELPRARIVGGQHDIRLYKYGRALEMSYEYLRRMRIDMVALYLQRLAINAETDKLAVVMDTMLNGDGNSGTSATSFNLTTLDPAATAPNLTLRAWLAFKLKFLNPYIFSTAIVQEATALQMMLLNTGSTNIPLVMAFPNQFGGITPMRNMLADQVRVGWTSAAPSLKIVAFDNRWATLRIIEIGSDISEIEKFAMRQTQAITMSETEGYAVFDPNAAMVLNLNS